MADSQRKTANLFDDHNVINIAGVGDRYGTILPNGTYSIYNGTDNPMYYGINNWVGRFTACSPHSTATITIENDAGKIGGVFMPLNSESQGGCTVIEGSTPPSSYIPYWLHSLRKLTTATEAVENPLYSDGTAITSYTIKGNTVQNGTPTPTNPIAVNGVGELVGSDYQIPISNGQQTTPIDLGSTQTKRRIYKFVLTGQENWGSSHLDVSLFALSGIDNLAKIYEVTAISTHYQSQLNVSIWSNVIDKRVCFHASNASNILYIRDSTYATVEDFTTYLSQQYANGTPVTVWYVLATPTTGTVNEPLMKIGTYVDTLSNAASIPTTEGANSITVDTTVQPSEFTATWTGWHDSSVKEYDGTDWT